MDPALAKDRYRRLTDHFQHCIDLSPELQNLYLQRVLNEDPLLGQELQALLRQHASHPVPDSAASPTADTASRPAAKPARRKISIALILLVVGVVLLLIILVGQVWAVGRMEETLRRESGQQLKTSLDLRVAEMRSWARERTALARRIFEDPAWAELPTSNLRAILERMKNVAAEPGIQGITIFSPSGLALGSDDPSVIGKSVSADGASYLRRIQQGEWILSRPQSDSELFLGRAAPFQRAVLFAGGPIRSARGDVVALGLIHFDPDPLYELLASPAMEFLAFDDKGLLLNDLGRTEPLRKSGLLPVCPKHGSAFRLRLRDPGSDLRQHPLPSSPVDRWPPTLMARSASQGVGGVDTSGQRDFRGQAVFQAWTWLPEWEMGVGAQSTEEEALASLSPIRAGLWLCALVCAFTGIILFLLARRDSIRRLGAPFGSYVLDRRIGRGATADIYLAHHSYLKRPAALKVLNDLHPRPDTVERFEREARIASRLGHPNTIQVFDYGRSPDGRLFLAMEYVDGLNLGQLVTFQHPLPVGRIVFILKQIAGSLDEAHQSGLVHRDLKPSNIMLSCRGGIADVVKVLDFGTASQIAGAGEDVTRSEMIVGTPAFIAPERIRTPLVLDPRSDIYSFGAVAFHLLTGRHVFEGDGPTELIYQVLTSPRPSPSQLRGERIPEELENLVVDCLSMGPASRPPTFRSVKERLRSIPLPERWGREEARVWWTDNREKVARFAQATS